MKKFLYFPIFIIFFSLTSCYEYFEEYNTSLNPAEIPFKKRKKQFEKKNLVKNYSFEKGKNLDEDSIINEFDLRDWEVIGDNVEWVNINEKPYDSTEASNGYRAIKISRDFEDIDELKPVSEGVMSDFIEVLPGNYLFTLDIKLQNIYPSIRRLNSKLSKDIDIRLYFYNDFREKISPGIYFEYWNKKIDNSFKGFSFSNFYEIENFGWGEVIGRTLNYPFSEGDLPDSCKYVKIFIGLKTEGTMWIDNVNFSLTKWNFTPKERISPYFDSIYHKSSLIIPTPQQIKDTSRFEVNNNFALLIPKKMKNADLSALKLLKTKIIQYFNPDTIIISDDTADFDNQTIISLGENILTTDKNKIFNDSLIPKNKNQAYFIKKIDNIFYLKGVSPVGNYYAVTTFVQLFDSVQNNIHYAEITDYPDFRGRSSKLIKFKNKWEINNDTSLTDTLKKQKIEKIDKLLQLQPDLIEYFAFYKINKMYNSYSQLSTRWWKPGNSFNQLFKIAGDKCNELGVIKTCLQINPYYHFSYEAQEELLNDSLRNIFSHSKTEDLQKILDIIEIALDNGAETIMLCADDFVPHKGKSRGLYTLFTDKDKKTFYNIAHAQNYMIDFIKKYIQKHYNKNIRIEFCPPPYLNQFIDYGKGSAEAYFRDLTSHLDSSVAIIWTGNTVRSLSYDNVDIFRYSNLIKRKPMIWDNSPYARSLENEYGGYPAHYPGKAVLCNIFEPFDIYYPNNFKDLINNHYYSNLGGFSETSKIKYASFADFTWNIDDYNPDFSLFKILYYQYGKKNAKLLLKFNDSYYKLVSIWAKIRNGLENSTPDDPYMIDKEDTDKAEEYIALLNENFDKIEKKINNERLVKELKNKKDKKIEQYKNMIKNTQTNEKQGRRQT